MPSNTVRKNLQPPFLQSGQVMIMVMGFVAAVLVVLTAFLGYLPAQIASQRNALLRAQALNIGESAGEIAIYHIRNDSGYAGDPSDYYNTYGGGEYNVAVTVVDDNYKNVAVHMYVPNHVNPLVVKTLNFQVGLGSSEAGIEYTLHAGPDGVDLEGGTVLGRAVSAGDILGHGAFYQSVTVTGSHQIAGDAVGNITVGTNDPIYNGAYSCMGVTVQDCGPNVRILGPLTHTGNRDAGCISSITPPPCSSDPINPVVPPDSPLPISDSQITAWKAQTDSSNSHDGYVVGGGDTSGDFDEPNAVVITGDVLLKSGATWNLGGATQIQGNLTVMSGATVTLHGMLYVTGDVTFDASSTVHLSSGYGVHSGMIISDGTISVGMTGTPDGTIPTTVAASGDQNSIILLLSTKSWASGDPPTIDINGTNVVPVTVYAGAGMVRVESNTIINQAMGKRVELEDTGKLSNYDGNIGYRVFSSGPGQPWGFVQGTYRVAH